MEHSLTPESELLSFLESFHQLSRILSEEPKMVENHLVVRGARMIAVHSNAGFDFTVPSLFETVSACVFAAADDFANGAVRLSKESVAIYQIERVYRMKWCGLEEKIENPLVFKILLRPRAEFANWPESVDRPLLSQDDINHGVYFLARALSDFIRVYETKKRPSAR